MKSNTSEENKVRQVARDYEKKGYNVVISPQGNDLPALLGNFSPDIIAYSEKENVVIEVKSRADMKDVESLKNVADAINGTENWRFELVVISDKSDEQPPTSQELFAIPNLGELLRKTDALVDIGMYDAALVIAWSYLESLARQLLLEDKKNMSSSNPLTLIKTLFSLGYLNKDEFNSLQSYFHYRNKIVHGFQVDGLNRITIDTFLQIIGSLAVQWRM